ADKPFRVLLAGKPNAGKSALFNALLGRQAALVSSQVGTTRDYLEATLSHVRITVQLVDVAGIAEAADPERLSPENATDVIETQAQSRVREQVQRADLIVYCRAADVEGCDEGLPSHWRNKAGQRRLRVATKCDLKAAPTDHIATSAVSGMGITELKSLLVENA